MKKKLILTIIAIALAICTCVCIASCNSDLEENSEDVTTVKTDSAQTETNAVETTDAQTESDTSADTSLEATSDTAATDTEVSESTTEQASESEAESESVSETEADSEETTLEDTSSTESETTEYRFDYFSESMKDYASIDPSVYESFSMTLGAEYEVDEEAISSYIEDLCFEYRYASNGSAKVTNQPIEKGDVAYIFYKGIMDGKEFEGGSNMDDASPYALTIGSGAFIPGFEEALIGVVPNETSPENMVAINITFPENYYEELAGRDVTFYVCVSWIVEYEIPEFNESFIRDTLKYESDSEDIVAAYTADIVSQLEAQVESQIAAMKENHIWTTLIEGMTVIKYPEGEVDSYYDYYYTEVEYYYSYYTYMGMKFESMDDFACQFLGLEDGADWKAEITKYAEDAAKQTMSYHIVAEAEGIELTEDDINKEIDAYIEYHESYYGKKYTREEILENMGEITIKESALCTKVLDHLMERLTVIYE